MFWRFFVLLFLGLSSFSYAQDDLQACVTSEDCVVIVQRCGHGAINKKYLQESKQKSSLPLENCLSLVDPHRLEFVPVCNENRCEAVAQ